MERVALLFPGQGSQYVGMSKTLYDRFEIAQKTFEEASTVLGIDFPRLCFESTLAEISRIENAHLALFLSSMVAFRVYMQEIGVRPIMAAGHSLGEYAALTCSGAIRFQDALQIVAIRSKMIQETAATDQGTMSVINGIDGKVLAGLCKEVSQEPDDVAISCYNSHNEFNISGKNAIVQMVEEKVLTLGGQVTPLFGSAPIHSGLMEEVSEELRKELEKYSYRKFLWPVISNVTGLFYNSPEDLVKNLTDQIKKPVRWDLTIKTLEKYRLTLTVELGAKNVLSNLLKSNQGNIIAASFDHKEGREYLSGLFSDNPIYIKHLLTVVTQCLATAVATPNLNQEDEAYQNGVIEPYYRLRKIQENLGKNNTKPSVEEMREALGLLKRIMDTKKIPAEEQAEWFEKIMIETGSYYLEDAVS